jgi:hypothetical protein
MSYKIWIGCTTDGLAIVGAKTVDEFADDGKLADTQQIYGSQMRYRVVAYSRNVEAAMATKIYKILTRTQANNSGYIIVDDFARYARR